MTYSDWLGRTETATDVVTEGLLDRFRATVEDTGAPVNRQAAPNGIHWCLAQHSAPMSALGPDGHPAKGGFLPPIALPRRMWAASELSFLAPIRAGAAITRTSTVASIREKSGSTGPLVFVEIDHRIDADGAEAVRDRQTVVYREASTGTAAKTSSVGLDESEAWEWRRTVLPDPVLLFRYSALTFNGHRIHYDEAYVTGVEHYPGLVVHGPLVATLLMDLCRRHLGEERLASFSFRAVAPAFAGHAVDLLGRRDGPSIDLRAATGRGRTVMTARAALQT